MSSRVFISEINKNLNQSVRDCFDSFGGVKGIVKGDVFIKINAAMPDLTAITDIDLVLQTVKVIKEEKSFNGKIYVFESAAVGFPTRLVYLMEDLAKRIKQLGAIPLYLDEQRSVDVHFKGKVLDYPVPFPKILYDKLIKDKDKNTYINIPRLKTHLHTEVTGCIKNQHGLIYDKDKIYKHHMMHEKILDIYSIIKPDFNIVDAIAVPNHGNFAYKEDWLIPYNLLLAGTDGVAVDTVGAKLLGVEADEVKYLKLAGEQGLGVSDYNSIEILPERQIVEKNKKNLNYIIENVPVNSADGVVFMEGSEKCCRAGCKYLHFFLKYLTDGKKARPFVTVVGKGHDTADLDRYPGPFLVNGPCSVEELRPYFKERKKKERGLKVIYVDEHFHLTKSMMGVVKGGKLSLMGMMDLLHMPMGKLMWGYMSAGFHRAKYINMM